MPVGARAYFAMHNIESIKIDLASLTYLKNPLIINEICLNMM